MITHGKNALFLFLINISFTHVIHANDSADQPNPIPKNRYYKKTQGAFETLAGTGLLGVFAVSGFYCWVAYQCSGTSQGDYKNNLNPLIMALSGGLSIISGSCGLLLLKKGIEDYRMKTK